MTKEEEIMEALDNVLIVIDVAILAKMLELPQDSLTADMIISARNTLQKYRTE